MHEQESPLRQPYERRSAFGFTEREQLFDRVGAARLKALLEATETTLHQAEVSSNLYGEFLFVTASRPVGEKREVVTFWGLGFHERRDRYILDEWQWYESSLSIKGEHEPLSKDEFFQRIDERRGELEAQARRHTQSKQGTIFEVLADLTDEDAAASEMDDLGDALDDFFGE